MISDELEKTLQRAKICAESLKHEFMTIEHLLFSMIDDFDVKEIFNACKADKAIAGAVFLPKGSSNIDLGFMLIFLISSATINLCSSLQIIIGS